MNRNNELIKTLDSSISPYVGGAHAKGRGIDLNNQFNNEDNYEEKKTNNILWDDMYDNAMLNMPEMFIQTGMIILNGYIGNKPESLKILLDTGASTSIIFTKTVRRLKLLDMVDDRIRTKIRGIGEEKIKGRIWYIDMKLNDINCPISLLVSNNENIRYDMILGINFMQSYGVIIDFNNRKIRLNNKYDIIFSYE